MSDLKQGNDCPNYQELYWEIKSKELENVAKEPQEPEEDLDDLVPEDLGFEQKHVIDDSNEY